MFYTTFFRKYRAPELVVAQVPYNWLMPLTAGLRPVVFFHKSCSLIRFQIHIFLSLIFRCASITSALPFCG